MTDHEQKPARRDVSEVHEEYVLHYEIKEKDFVTKYELLTTLAPNYRRGLIIYWAIVVVNVLISVWLLADVTMSGDEIKPWYFINFGCAVFILLMRHVAWPARLKSLYKNSGLEGVKYEAHLSADEVRIVGPGTDATIQWSIIKGVVETERQFFLIHTKIDAMTIPVRAFENEKQKQVCLKLIRNKVGDYPVGQNENALFKSTPAELFD